MKVKWNGDLDKVDMNKCSQVELLRKKFWVIPIDETNISNKHNLVKNPNRQELIKYNNIINFKLKHTQEIFKEHNSQLTTHNSQEIQNQQI